MKKLNLDALAVTSFDTTPAAARERGTVNAHAGPSTYGADCSYLTACPPLCSAIPGTEVNCT